MKFLKPAALVICLFALSACHDGVEDIKSDIASLSKTKPEENENKTPGQSDQIADTTRVSSQKHFNRQRKQILNQKLIGIKKL